MTECRRSVDVTALLRLAGRELDDKGTLTLLKPFDRGWIQRTIDEIDWMRARISELERARLCSDMTCQDRRPRTTPEQT